MKKDSKTKQRVKDERTRTWAFVAYPESMPENWRAVLDELCVPWACSPLHDKDVNETTGELKKAHYHFVLSFEGPKSYEQVKAITDKLKATIPQKCMSIRGAVRYMAHLDNPEKAQYSISNIVTGMGFDVEDALKLSVTEEEDVLDEMCAFIEDNWIVEFCDFNSYVRKERKEWRTILRHNCFFISQIIKSQRHKEIKARQQEQI